MKKGAKEKGRSTKKRPKVFTINCLRDMLSYYKKTRTSCEGLLESSNKMLVELRDQLSWSLQKEGQKDPSLGPGKVSLEQVAYWLLFNLESQIQILEQCLEPLDKEILTVPKLLQALQDEVSQSPQWTEKIINHVQTKRRAGLAHSNSVIEVLGQIGPLNPKLQFLKEELEERHEKFLGNAIDYCSSHHALGHLCQCSKLILSREVSQLKKLKEKLQTYSSPFKSIYQEYLKGKEK